MFSARVSYEKSVDINLLLGQRATRDIRDPESREIIVRKNRKFTRSAIKQIQALKIERISVDEEDVIGSGKRRGRGRREHRRSALADQRNSH